MVIYNSEVNTDQQKKISGIEVLFKNDENETIEEIHILDDTTLQRINAIEAGRITANDLEEMLEESIKLNSLSDSIPKPYSGTVSITTSANGSYFTGQVTISFPITFKNLPIVIPNTGNLGVNMLGYKIEIINIGKTQATIRLQTPSAVTWSIPYIIIGV